MSLRLRKLHIVIGTVLFSVSSLAIADYSRQERLLGLIATYTKSTANNVSGALDQINKLPTFLQSLYVYTQSWINPDDSKATSESLLPNFASLGLLLTNDLTSQSAMLAQENIDLFSGDASNSIVVNANDLAYSSMLGQPFYTPDPRDTRTNKVNYQYNFIKNASGLSLNHSFPNGSWGGSSNDRNRYSSYYNTILAVESFNGYILSNHYTEGNQFSKLQNQLVSQATDPKKWFAAVASESIGVVLRQLLLYQSQIFVLLTQLVQTQKQMVTAQAMNNAVIIASNQTNESVMVARAQGLPPR